jgi:hypothetical protein
MKKIFALLTAVVITASSFAGPVTEKVKAAFAKEFNGAKFVEWKDMNGYFVATFKINNEALTAWFSEDGNVEAIQRNITADKATLLASRTIASVAENATITALVEVTQSGSLYYLVKTEDGKHITTYKVYADGESQKIERRKL